MGLFSQEKKKVMSIEEAVQGRGDHISFIINLLEASNDEKNIDLLNKIYDGEYFSKSDLSAISDVVFDYLGTLRGGFFASRRSIDHKSFVLDVCEGLNYSLRNMDY